MNKLFFLLALVLPPTSWAEDCSKLEGEAVQLGAHIPSYMSGRTVIGKGRLQFYSSPDLGCKQPGIFILAGETVDAYIEYKGFSSVLYLNLKTGSEAQGWVLSSRLKENGYGIGPRQ